MAISLDPTSKKVLEQRGALIVTLRGDRSQKTCAHEARVHQTTWSGYERGAHDMSTAHALRIAPVLGITPAELLTGELTHALQVTGENPPEPRAITTGETAPCPT